MSRLIPQKIILEQINGGQEYKNGDGVDASAINGALKASALAQAIATNKPIVTETGDQTAPSVNIKNPDTNPQLEFINIKGEKGDKGDSADDNFVRAIDNKVNVVDKKTNAILGVLGEENFIRAESVENTSAVRETAYATANGFELIDDFPTNVKLLKGNTIRTKNLIKYPFEEIKFTLGEGESYTFLMSDGAITYWGKLTGVHGSNSFVEGFMVFPLSYIDFIVGRKYKLKNFGNGLVYICYKEGSSNKYKFYTKTNEEFEWKSEYREGCVGLLLDATPHETAVADRKSVFPILTEVLPNEANIEDKFFNYTKGLKHSRIKSIKSTGKNLINYLDLLNGVGLNNHLYTINIDKSISTKNIGYNAIALFDPIKLPKGTYSFSYKVRLDDDIPTEDAWITLAFRKYSDGLKETHAYSNIMPTGFSVGGCYAEYDKYISHSQTFTVSEEGYYSFGMFATGSSPYVSSGINITLKDIQLEFGETATEYEPYKESVIEFPEELELGKWDYIDFETGEIVRATKTITLTGNETFGEHKHSENINVFVIYTADKKIDASQKNCIISSPYLLKQGTAGSSLNGTYGIYSGSGATSNIYIRPLTEMSTLDEFRSYISGLYNSGNPLVVSYELANPTREKIIFNNSYFVWNKGFEKIESSYDERGLTSFDYGANTIEENDYFGKV